MTILILLEHSHLTGVNTCMSTLAKELYKQGHEIDVFTGERPWVEDSLLYSLWFNNVYRIRDSYDVVFFNYSKDVEKYAPKIKKSKKLFFCHGLMNSDYILPKDKHQLIDRVFVFGERSFDLWNTGTAPVTLIRQPIDFSDYKISYPRFGKPLNISFVNSRGGILVKEIFIEITKKGFFSQLIINSLFTKERPNLQNLWRKADVVVAYGRTALEAAACGKHVIIYGHNGGDGLLNKKTYSSLAQTNFSGWSEQTISVKDANKLIAVNWLEKEINKCSLYETFRLRNTLFKNHNVQKITKQILSHV